MQLSELFSVDHIVPSLRSRTKEDAFREMVHALVAVGAISDEEKVMEGLQLRESMMSTAVTPKIAIPHASLWLFKRRVGAFGISREGIDYDGTGTYNIQILMMLIDDRYDSDSHLDLLKQSARLIGSPNFISRMLRCDTAAQVHELIVEIEQLHAARHA